MENATLPLHAKAITFHGAKDVGYHASNIDPVERKGCVGKSGIDATYSFEQVAALAFEVRANIIIKNGPKAKWYLKRCPKALIAEKTEKNDWHVHKGRRMFEIEWE